MCAGALEPVPSRSRWAKADNFLPISVPTGGVKVRRLYSFHVGEFQGRHTCDRINTIVAGIDFVYSALESSINAFDV